MRYCSEFPNCGPRDSSQALCGVSVSWYNVQARPAQPAGCQQQVVPNSVMLSAETIGRKQNLSNGELEKPTKNAVAFRKYMGCLFTETRCITNLSRKIC